MKPLRKRLLANEKSHFHDEIIKVPIFSNRWFRIPGKKVALQTRVARWFVFKPKIPIWVKFGGPWNGKGWYIL
jgi:hypothetical protein